MSSRTLGPHTKEIRNNLIELDDECFPIINGKKNDENEELYQRSLVALASSSSPSKSILKGILAAGVNYLKISTLACMFHLVTFALLKDKSAMIESKWLENWFEALSDAIDSCAAIWHETWIKVYGVPLSARCYENFFNIHSVHLRTCLQLIIQILIMQIS